MEYAAQGRPTATQECTAGLCRTPQNSEARRRGMGIHRHSTELVRQGYRRDTIEYEEDCEAAEEARQVPLSQRHQIFASCPVGPCASESSVIVDSINNRRRL